MRNGFMGDDLGVHGGISYSICVRIHMHWLKSDTSSIMRTECLVLEEGARESVWSTSDTNRPKV
mgnify:FL=1